MNRTIRSMTCALAAGLLACPLGAIAAPALSHDQIVRTCQAKHDIAEQMMAARQAGTPKSALEDKAAQLPVVAGETGQQLLQRVYDQPREKPSLRDYTTAVFAGEVFQACNKTLAHD